jgi:hypothetical protein
MKITITGPRAMPPAAADRCEVLFERYMAPFVREGHEFFVGGAVGIDTLALDWLATRQSPVTVVVPATVEDQQAPADERIRHAQRAGLAEVVELRHPSTPSRMPTMPGTGTWSTGRHWSSDFPVRTAAARAPGTPWSMRPPRARHASSSHSDGATL